MITKIGENAGLIWGALQNGAQGSVQATSLLDRLLPEGLP